MENVNRAIRTNFKISRMKFIKFPEAHSYLPVPNVGQMHFYLMDIAGVTCVELTDRELETIKQNGNRIYIITPKIQDAPAVPLLYVNSPFIIPGQVNGKKKD
jgi:hypothetical protein